MRERGGTRQALEGLCAIRAKAAMGGHLEAASLATAHIIVCYKHLYQNTNAETYLLQMEAELEHALASPLPDGFKAIFWMRCADVECERGNFHRAEFLCDRAYHMIEKSGYAEAECLGRSAHVKTMLGKLTEAENSFERAIEIISGMHSPKSFRSVTLESGLLARWTNLTRQ